MVFQDKNAFKDDLSELIESDQPDRYFDRILDCANIARLEKSKWNVVIEHITSNEAICVLGRGFLADAKDNLYKRLCEKLQDEIMFYNDDYKPDDIKAPERLLKLANAYRDWLKNDSEMPDMQSMVETKANEILVKQDNQINIPAVLQMLSYIHFNTLISTLPERMVRHAFYNYRKTE